MAKIFEQKFRSNVDWVNKRLEAHIKDPYSEKRIHDMRTSLRRLYATFSVLPKKVRKQNRREMKKCKKFFKAIGEVRDYDVIRRRLVALEASREAIMALKKQRNQEMRKTILLARSLTRMAPMKLDGITEGKLNERISKVIGNIANRIEKLIPIVLSDSTKIKDLHRLRKDCKRLRYILEVAPDNCKKKYYKIIANAIHSSSLEVMQDMIGALHDSDITIQYLQNINSPLVDKETTCRKRQYAAFVRYMRKK